MTEPPSLTDERGAASRALTDDELRFWDENGYLILDVLFDEDQLDRFRDHLARVFEGAYETGVAPRSVLWSPGDSETALREIDYGWRADYALRDAILSPAVGALAAQLMRTPTVRLFMDTLLHKPGIGPEAERTGVVGWHQDYAYWTFAAPPDLLTARIPLDRETVENGCMRVIPGSHRWPLQEHVMHYYDQTGDVDALPAFDVPKEVSVELVACALEPGQLMFHHCLTMHASAPNRTDGPRRSTLAQLMPAHMRYVAARATKGETAAMLGLLLEGSAEERDRAECEFFPVVWPTP
jgi:ectoine hydroxylase-related dioxygenase (phytanoyl-CoA dioxygenase family)